MVLAKQLIGILGDLCLVNSRQHGRTFLLGRKRAKFLGLIFWLKLHVVNWTMSKDEYPPPRQSLPRKACHNLLVGGVGGYLV